MTAEASAAQESEWWEHKDGGILVLHIGERYDTVPALVATLLLDPKRRGISGDVAGDVLRLEAQLRDLDHRLTNKLTDIGGHVTAGQLHLAEVGKTWFAARRRAVVRAGLQAALDAQTEAGEAHAEVLSLQRILRSFVIAMEPDGGLLAEAAAGWARASSVPPGVAVFQNDQYFLLDTRRAAGPEGLAGTIGGEDFGELWRRDGDDPVDEPLNRVGCWLVGYIERSQEIYAVRRSDSQTREVWLLGRGFSKLHAHELLLPLATRMQEPNSVILVAEAVSAARHDHAGRRAV